MKHIIFVLFVVILTSCATIPQASLQLSEAIQEQSTAMHQMNVDLVNMYYAQRAKEIDEFISDTYTITMLNNVKTGLVNAGLYNDTVYLDAMPLIHQKIITKRDYLQAELETERLNAINTLNDNYKNHIINCLELNNLLESAIKVDDETEQLLQNIDNLTKNKLNLQELDDKMNNILLEAGKISKTIETGGKDAEKVIDKAQEFINKNKKDK